MKAKRGASVLNGTLVPFRPIDYQAAFLSNPKQYKLTSGGFGCTSPETYILMFDGSKKMAKDIGVGELLMGLIILRARF